MIRQRERDRESKNESCSVEEGGEGRERDRVCMRGGRCMQEIVRGVVRACCFKCITPIFSASVTVSATLHPLNPIIPQINSNIPTNFESAVDIVVVIPYRKHAYA